MPTLRGWIATGVAAGLIVLWIALGEELLGAGGLLLALAVIGNLIYTRRTLPAIRLGRRVTPRQLHAGQRAIVHVTLATDRKVRHIHVEDSVDQLGSARFVAGNVDAGSPVGARYEVMCHRRGVYSVGPATTRVLDPLRLSESGGFVGSQDRLVVYPAVEDLDGSPLGRGYDPSQQATRANFAFSGGEDFYTLREYQRGDDLRRVHWPSSAKRDELMIRQLEMPWQSRALILLDHRASAYPSPDAFEHAVTGAASVTRHLYRSGYSPSLWAGGSAGTVTTSDSYATAMESLAVVEPEGDFDLKQIVTRLRRAGMAGGVLVFVTGSPSEAHLAAYRVLGRDFLRTVVLSVTQSPNDAILALQRAGAVVVRSPVGAGWALPWKQEIERIWSTAPAG
ncbi:MAG: DUF58 domain-containing protein [Acidimicrobiia bacterium]|nr:DUF58 domain-containing protein [Acidimicrobiia bacterium]MBT8214226.1 DUF58 domain-containing protein [Acidimicrobiia bacterium]NNF69175.1 DUF58 domain-containing protein [Acidimicrobiia bacterium]